MEQGKNNREIASIAQEALDVAMTDIDKFKQFNANAFKLNEERDGAFQLLDATKALLATTRKQLDLIQQ